MGSAMHAFTLLIACVLMAFSMQTATASTVWPKPQSMTTSSARHRLASSFTFSSSSMSTILLDAKRRYQAIVTPFLDPSGDLTGCVINISSSDESLTLQTDESYNLTVSASGASINAVTVYGALRGLETFSQLVDQEGINETQVIDFPRFHFRATMIDTSRHWYPVVVIKAHLDAMSYAKMNVLHWHIVDSISFPYESVTFPSLSETGAFSPSHVYTPADVAEVIEYARLRGIRVIPEFDTPGHMDAGFNSIPNLLTECYDGSGNPTGTTGPVNPTLNSTYDFMRKFYAEVKSVFPDKFVHVGGDEVSFTCWQSNPQIQAWMKQHPEVSTYADLEQYYELNLLEILSAQNTSYICWQEIFDNGVKILPDTVVDVWKSEGWNDTMARVTQAGYNSVLSAPFYLNYISYGEDWPNYYSVEPTDFDAPQADKDRLVGGIEACMWSEFVDATNFIPRFWPRVAAVAERAWSAQSVNDVNEATPRIHEFRCKLIARGINAEPALDGNNNGGLLSFCNKEWIPAYQPPF
eukprot:m.53038 g.53038  ORF g.53038 m.53038 type:complete len:523 (-) comp12750_c0_seq1:250-1818(-)